LIILTGATGNVGTELVRALASVSERVRVAARNPAAVTAPGMEIVPFDLEDPSTFRPAFQGARAVFLLRPHQVQMDLAGAVEAARCAGVERIVFLSVAGAGHNARVPHRAIEQEIEASGMAWTFLRPNFFMQNLSTIHREDIRGRKDVFVPAGDGRVAYVDVRDIAAVAALCLTQPRAPGAAYELTGPRAIDHAEVASILSRTLGQRITYSSPSPDAFADPFIGEVYASVRAGHMGHVTDDVQHLLGRPAISFEQFAQDYRECWT